MEWVDSLSGAVVGLDTTPLIYYMEANPAYIAMLDPFLTRLIEASLRLSPRTSHYWKCLFTLSNRAMPTRPNNIARSC